MPKRKAGSRKRQGDANGAGGAKKPCTEGAAAAEADAADPKSPIKSALVHADLVQRTVTQTLKLADAMHTSSSSFAQRMQTVVDLLQADASRSESLIDLSLVPEGDESCVMFQLLRFFDGCIPKTNDTADVKENKLAAQGMIIHQVWPFMQKLLRSFDPATVDAATGNNALHEMCSLFTLDDPNSWSFKLAELLIDHGVSVHVRNEEGCTPLLQKAVALPRFASAANGLRLLLKHGSDLNAQDGDGNGLLHLLVERKAADPLDALFDGDGAGPLDFTLRNSAGQTAADLAAVKLAQLADNGADCPEKRIHRLVATQTAMQIKHAKSAPPRRSQPMAAIQPNSAAAAAADSGGSLNADLVRAQLVPRMALQTLKLAGAIKKADSNHTQRMQAVADQLQADASRSQSLIDLSLVPEGDESCVLFQLLKFFWSCIPDAGDAGDLEADRLAAVDLIRAKVLPLMPTLLRSFDPTTVDTATGNNALHEMCRLFPLENKNGWTSKLTELLIARGVSVHVRDKDSRTVLLRAATSATGIVTSANCVQLLLAHGADPNAQDNDGNGLLHHLVKNAAFTMLEDFLRVKEVGHLDCHLVNSAGQTAADLAAVQLAQLADNGADSPQKRIHRLMMAQTALWAKHARPALLRCLESSLPVTDVAKLALGYIDGSGPPFDKAADPEAESDEEAEPAAAAAAAQS